MNRHIKYNTSNAFGVKVTYPTEIINLPDTPEPLRYMLVKSPNDMQIIEELDDYHFDMGYRFVRYIPDSQVNIHLVEEYLEDVRLKRLLDSPSDPYCYITEESNDSDGYFLEPLEIY